MNKNEKKRNGSMKKSPSAPKKVESGKEEFFLAKEFIMHGETASILSILLKLLETDYRLSAALELAYYFFQKKEYYLAEPYLNILIEEEKNAMIKAQAKRMKLYLYVICNISPLPRNQESYFDRQIVDYQSEEFLYHLQTKRISFENKYDNNKFYYFLKPDEIVEKVKPYLNNQVCHGYDALDTYHMIAYNSGIAADELASTIDIITIRDTKNIVDIYPSNSKSRRLIKPDHPIDFTTRF